MFFDGDYDLEYDEWEFDDFDEDDYDLDDDNPKDNYYSGLISENTFQKDPDIDINDPREFPFFQRYFRFVVGFEFMDGELDDHSDLFDLDLIDPFNLIPP